MSLTFKIDTPQDIMDMLGDCYKSAKKEWDSQYDEMGGWFGLSHGGLHLSELSKILLKARCDIKRLNKKYPKNCFSKEESEE